MANNDISVKGLDDFSRKFLIGTNDAEYVQVTKGQQLKPEAYKRYEEEKMKEFIKRAGEFCEDLVSFVIEQKKLRQLSDIETVFGLALATINLRNAYGSPQNSEEAKALTAARKEELLTEFDNICVGAQEFYDANT